MIKTIKDINMELGRSKINNRILRALSALTFNSLSQFTTVESK